MTIWLVDDATELMPDTIQHAETVAQYNKFLKDLREMSYLDWLIEKKLVEAGGLGKRVYISVPRCHGKTFTLMKHVEELEAKGKEVHFVDYRDSAKKQPTLDDIAKVREYMIDWDLLANRDLIWKPTLVDMRMDFEFEKVNPEFLQLATYEQLNRELFRRRVLGEFIFKEEENGDDQNRERADREHYGRRTEEDCRRISFDQESV